MEPFEKLLRLFDGFPSPSETIRRAAGLLRETFSAEAVGFLVYSSRSRSLVFQVVDGGAENLVGTGISDGPGVAWWAFRHGFVTVEDCASDARFSGMVDESTGFGTRNLVALPFGYRGKALGVIELLNVPSVNGEVAAERRAALMLMAGHIGVAYAAANLHHRLALQKKRLEQANLDLERKVDERTGELRATLARLQKQNELLQRTQTQLVQTEKMAALGQLAAGVAHEINNPIGFIASNLNTAREYLDQLLTYANRLAEANPATAPVYRKKYDIDFVESDTLRLVDECLEGTVRVTNIVRNLKEFAHQSRGEVAAVNVGELIDRTLSIALSPYRHKVDVCKEYQAPESLVCDAQALGQVILNLAVNAAQAIVEHGVITVRTALKNDTFVVEVEDTGCGIAEENLHRIFEPFFTTKEVGVGTGLGLSTCFHLIRQAGGDIKVRSTVGRGTVFCLELPRNVEVAA